MRVIRGKYKGRRLTAPKAIKARPTTDFAKEGLFNILENTVELIDAKVLDLFTGTGNISFEFASRGAASVTAIDISSVSVKFINNQAKLWELPIRAFKNNVFKYLAKPIGSYDIIFADPPYSLEGIEKLPDLILSGDLLTDNGILIIEHGRETDYCNHPKFINQRTYSKVNFSFFKHNQE